MPVIPFFFIVYARSSVSISACFTLCGSVRWRRNVTSATVLLGLTLAMGRNAVDLTPAVTRFLVPFDRTKYYCM